ncbi:ThuA domain-containing protein [Cohnella caldifontis]|uniref:ThuA domain-containing protein n=1 Tax=Cohnella caldifontis TaxID=3027471 RepID=UPI0023EDE6A0|nr:ThuA domain-containing protein [Cohnella sp. YIM B05605]
MKRIFAVVGDFYHRPEDAGGALQQALLTWAGAGDVSLRFIEATRLIEALEEAPDAVVLFKEDRVAPQEDENARWMTDETGAAISRYVEGGGGWLAWHSGLAGYEPSGSYVAMTKGRFLHHPAENRPVRYVPEPGRGFADPAEFEVLDEHYFVECKTEETEVFLRSESVDGQSIAGWRHGYGSGRVCCLTPAHRREGLTDPAFLRLLGQAVRWCCGA